MNKCLPRCDRCGVECIADYEGPCEERVDRRQEISCGGTVSWRVTAELFFGEMENASIALRRLVDLSPEMEAEAYFAAKAWLREHPAPAEARR